MYKTRPARSNIFTVIAEMIEGWVNEEKIEVEEQFSPRKDALSYQHARDQLRGMLLREQQNTDEKKEECSSVYAEWRRTEIA